MGRKTRSTKREGEQQPAWSAPAPVSVEEAGRLHERAVTLREQGQHAEAATCARHALIFFERACGPDHPDVANILNNLAGICADQGDSDEAVRLAQRAVAIMEPATGSPDLALLRVQSLRTLAHVHEALTIAQELPHTITVVQVLAYAARIHQCRQEGRAAQERAEEAIALATELGAPQWIASATIAYDLLAPVYNWFTEGFGTADLQEARALLEALGA